MAESADTEEMLARNLDKLSSAYKKYDEVHSYVDAVPSHE